MKDKDTSMKTWNFGIVGAGLIAEFHAKAIANISNARLAAVCDTAKNKADALASQFNCKAFGSYEEMLKERDIDIVTIATPSGLHLEPSIAAAKAGKHVLCEKPLEVTIERINAMIDAHYKAGTLLGSVLPSRFADAVLPMREAVCTGRLGIITCVGVYVPWWRNDEYYKNSWHGTWKLDGGGALMNQSIHTIDIMCSIMPPVKSVAAFTGRLAHPQIQAEDTAVAVLQFQNGSLGLVYGTTGSFPGQGRRLEITGTKGTIIFRENTFDVWKFADELPHDAQIMSQFCKTSQGTGIADPKDIDSNGHTRNFQAFINTMEKGEELILDGKEGRKSVELITAIYKAAKEQKIINL